MSDTARTVLAGLGSVRSDLEDLYQDLHRHPELGLREHRTAKKAAESLRRSGYDVTEGVGGTGVIGVLANGDGPVVMARADMDALPVRERTGLPYASTATVTDEDGREQPVMHACGHDVHVTSWSGARGCWPGTGTTGGAPSSPSSSPPRRTAPAPAPWSRTVSPTDRPAPTSSSPSTYCRTPPGTSAPARGPSCPPRTVSGSPCTAGARTVRRPRRRSTPW